VTDVLEYAVSPEPGQRGLFLMNSDSQDGEVCTGMIGCGAQIVAFTSGRGNPTGFPIAPVIKVTGNEPTFKKMHNTFDFDASGIISGRATLQQLGRDLFDLVVRVANGELVQAEKLGGDELFCVARR
jgi:altronate dehydratase large subunit